MLTFCRHREMIPAMTASVFRTKRAERKGGSPRIAPRPSESPSALAERAVADLEARCARQQQILADLEQHHVPSAAVAARELLDSLKCALKQAQRALQQLQNQRQRREHTR
jgi:hypothetical protein